MKIVCIGDSITAGLGVSQKNNWVTLSGEGTIHNLINCGISGDTTSGMMARFHNDVLQKKPDATIIFGGCNDIFFSDSLVSPKVNISAMLHQAVHYDIIPIIATPLPFCPVTANEHRPEFVNFQKSYSLCKEYSQWLGDLSKMFGNPLIDFWAYFASIDKDKRHGLYLDGIHPNRSAHRQMAEIVNKTLLMI